jgi:hypothetical protein
VSGPKLQADEKVLVRVIAADPRSDWVHGYSAGPLYLTDRRLVLHPWAAFGGTDAQPWELPLDAIDKVSSVPVPIWLFGLVRIWLRGVRLVTGDGTSKTIIVRHSRAPECVATLEALRKARRRSSVRTATTSPS